MMNAVSRIEILEAPISTTTTASNPRSTPQLRPLLVKVMAAAVEHDKPGRLVQLAGRRRARAIASRLGVDEMIVISISFCGCIRSNVCGSRSSSSSSRSRSRSRSRSSSCSSFLFFHINEKSHVILSRACNSLLCSFVFFNHNAEIGHS